MTTSYTDKTIATMKLFLNFFAFSYILLSLMHKIFLNVSVASCYVIKEIKKDKQLVCHLCKKLFVIVVRE